MPASDMSSIWSYSSLRPRKVSWIGLNCSCSSYFSSNQAFRRAVSDCWSLVAAVAAAAVSGLAAGCLQATRANGRASARATARELRAKGVRTIRSEEHTSELHSLMRISYAVFCLKKKKNRTRDTKQKYKKTLKNTQTKNVSDRTSNKSET